MNPRSFASNDKDKKRAVYRKLWKYARDVMEMEKELKMNVDPEKGALGITKAKEHKFNLGNGR